MVTLAFIQLHVDLASTAFADLVVILLFSLMGSFTASALLSLVSVAGLAYFFAPPIFQFRIDAPHHVAVLVAFFFTSLIVTHLIRNARKEKEAALQAEAKLRRSQVDLRDSEREWREVFEHNPVMYFMVDAAGTVLNVNSFGAAQLGYSPADLARPIRAERLSRGRPRVRPEMRCGLPAICRAVPHLGNSKGQEGRLTAVGARKRQGPAAGR